MAVRNSNLLKHQLFYIMIKIFFRKSFKFHLFIYGTFFLLIDRPGENRSAVALPWSLESDLPAADCGPAFRRSGGWPVPDRDPGRAVASRASALEERASWRSTRLWNVLKIASCRFWKHSCFAVAKELVGGKPDFCHVQMPVCTNKSVLFSALGGLHRLWEDYLWVGERSSSGGLMVSWNEG